MNLVNIFKNTDKKTLIVFLFFRVLIIICLFRELLNGNYENVFLCILSLFLFLIPYFLEKTFKIDFPGVFERIVYIFIFSAEILGEINNFYGTIPFWDNMLHTINGFLCASLGFSLVYIINKQLSGIKLSPFFVSLVAFCFSMTIGVCWEIFEYGMDCVFKTDMQKDVYIKEINSVEFDSTKSNKVINIDGIDKVIVNSNDNDIEIDNYLDIGLHDTMIDLIVNFIGAFVFSVFGYLYITNEKKYKLAGVLMTTSVKN